MTGALLAAALAVLLWPDPRRNPRARLAPGGAGHRIRRRWGGVLAVPATAVAWSVLSGWNTPLDQEQPDDQI